MTAIVFAVVLPIQFGRVLFATGRSGSLIDVISYARHIHRSVYFIGTGGIDRRIGASAVQHTFTGDPRMICCPNGERLNDLQINNTWQ
jgi:hypothetical protein